MPELDTLLDRLTKQGRVAVGCACVEHVLDLYKLASFSYKTGAAAGALGAADPDGDIADAALARAWRFAETGEAPDDKALEAFKKATSTPPAGMTHQDMSLPGLEVLDALELVLQAAKDPTPDCATKALETCQDALGDMLEDLEGGTETKADAACAQELSWQEAVIDRATTVKVPFTRAIFADLIARQLPWSKHLPEYEASK
jgi:hypothetical protein